MMTLRWLRAVSVTLFLVCLGACGSGGGGGGPTSTPPVQIDGAYFFHHITCFVGPPTAGTGTWETFTGDGVNMITSGSFTRNASGVQQGPIPYGPIPYTAGPDGDMSIGGATPRLGGITESGDVMVLGTFSPGQVPSFGIATRKAGTFDETSLSGDYHLAAFFTNGALMGDTSWYGGTASFNSTTLNVMAPADDHQALRLRPRPAVCSSVRTSAGDRSSSSLLS